MEIRQYFSAFVYILFFVFATCFFLAKLKSFNDNTKTFSGIQASPGGNSFFRRFNVDFIFICVLVIASIKFTYGLEKVMDITLSDESFYLYTGVKLAEHGFHSVQWGPLYTLWYYLLSLFEKDTVQLFYLNYKVLILCTTLAFYVYLRRVGVVTFIACIATFLYLVSESCLLWPFVALFALLVLLLFLIVASLTRSEEAYYCVVGFGILMVSFIRPEYFISVVLCVLIFYFLILQNLKRGLLGSKLTLAKIVVFLSSVVLLTYSLRILKSPNPKQWPAFGQHFSINFVAWNNLSNNPWTEYREIIRSVFGEVNTITGAAISNGKEFFRHIVHNAIRYLPASVRVLLIGPQHWTIPLFSRLATWAALLFSTIITMSLFIKREKIAMVSNNTSSVPLLVE